MKKVAIIDYGMGNLDSSARGVRKCGAEPVIADQARELKKVDAMILPGVGAFADGMKQIRSRGLDKAIRDRVLGDAIPLLGVCLGMQLLASWGTEGGNTEGLGLIAGRVERLQPSGHDTRIPHVGWNEVQVIRPSPLFEGIPSGMDFYFSHSYHLLCDDEQDVVARTPYCGVFVSAVERGTVFGVQFHPEKSQKAGLRLLRNFLKVSPHSC